VNPEFVRQLTLLPSGYEYRSFVLDAGGLASKGFLRAVAVN
jgi:hypothetical protein